MRIRRTTLGLLLVLATATAADAQLFGRPRPRTSPPQSAPSNVNSRHERMKIEAQEAYQRGQHEHTVDLTSSVLRENPNDDVALYLRASARVELGKQKKDTSLVRSGIADARTAISLKTTANALYYLPYLYGMSTLTELEDRHEHATVATEVAEQVLGRPGLSRDESANILYQRGVAHVAIKQIDKAAEDFERAIRANSQHLGAYVALADAYSRDGKADRAAATFDRAVRAFPNSHVVYNNRGLYRRTQRDFAGAISDFSRALQLKSDFTVGYTNRGFARLEQGDARGAELDFAASLRLDPSQNGNYSMRGTARLAQGKVDLALQDFREFVSLEPKNPLAYADLGFAQFFAANYAAARSSFEKASSLSPSLRYLQPWQYWSMQMSGASKEELAQFLKTRELDPRPGEWIDSLVGYLAGDVTEEQLMKALVPNNPQLRIDQTCEAHFFIGQKEAHAGRTKEAAEHFEKALATSSRHLSAFRGAQYALKKFSAGSGGASVSLRD